MIYFTSFIYTLSLHILIVKCKGKYRDEVLKYLKKKGEKDRGTEATH
jgi:hypothetical protein